MLPAQRYAACLHFLIMPSELSPRAVALITGASQGIGKAIALRLADTGYDIGLNDIPSSRDKLASLEEQIVLKGRRVCVVIADVSIETEVEGMVDEVVKELGSIDVVSVENFAYFVSSSCHEDGS